MVKAFHFFVSGRVQGVFFRARTKQQADLRGLAGWVRNLPDGRVEGVVEGPEAQLEDLRTWLARGPQMARVLKLEWQEIPSRSLEGFKVR